MENGVNTAATTGAKRKGFMAVFVLFGLIEAGWQVFWAVYNNYMPILMQGGGGEFAKYIGFGLTALLAGLVMSVDNFIGLLFGPIYGAIGDNAKSRKRLVLITGILGAVLILLIPLIKSLLPEGSNSVAGSAALFSILLLAILTVVVSWGLNTSLNTALSFSVVKEENWEDLNGIVMLAMGIFVVFTMVFLGMFFKETDGYLFAAGFILVANLLVAIFVKEPENTTFARTDLKGKESKNPFKTLALELRYFSKEERLGVLTVAFMKVFGIFGIMALQTYASSWIVATFGLPPMMGLLIVAVYFVGYLVATVPVSKIVKKTGVKKMARMAFVVEIVAASACIVIGSFPSPTTVYLLVPFLIAIGACNAIFDVTTTPAALQFCAEKRTIGATIGVTATITKIAPIVAVPVCGALMDLTGWRPVMFAILIVASIAGLLLTRKYKQPDKYFCEDKQG